MRPVMMIVGQILSNQVVEVPLAENNKVVEALLLQRLEKSLDKRNHVRCPESRSQRFHALLAQTAKECLQEFGIAIVLHSANAKFSCPCFDYKRRDLLHDPRIIGMPGR